MKKLKQMLMMLMMLAGHSAWSATVSIPQELGKYIDWNNAALTDCKVENNGANIGSTHSNSAAVFTLSNPTEQNYCMTMKTGASGLTAVLTVTVKNGTAVLFTKDCDVDNTGSWATTSEHWFDLGKLPVSDKLTLEIKVKSTTGSYAGNYGDLALYGVSQFDNIPSAEGSYISLSGGTHSGARYEEKNDNIGYITNATYSIYNVWNTADVYAAMKMDIIGFYNAGQVKLTVTDVLTGAQEAQQTFDITAQENGKTFPISEPLTKGLKKIRMDYVSESDGFIMNYKNLQLVKVSDYSLSAELTLKSLTVEGFDLPAEGLAALKENGGAYTLAGNLYTSVPRVEATMSNLAGATVTSSEVQDGKVVFTIKSTNYQSTLTVEGLHIYAAQPNDQTVQLKYTSEGKSGDGSTVWLPTKRYALKNKSYDLIVNIEGHKAGQAIAFSIVKAGQPTAWFELVVEETTGGNPSLSSQSVTVVDNHAVVALAFDREMKDITTTFEGKTYTADGGSTKVHFPLWDLQYNASYTFTIAKENIQDKYGNKALADVSVTFSTASVPVVAMSCYDYVVSNADELDAAIANLKSSNNSDSAPRRTVFLKNGAYTYGTLEGTYQHNISLAKVYNVSLIGESKDGVIVSGTTDGITSSTIDLGDGTGNYLQDITIRNNYDFRAEQLKGVSVALTGGNKTIMKNVALQASQDTYVTGKRTYLEDCDIYGTTDFICGGGDIYFERCNLILGNKSGNVISAPSTSPDNKWGYVFRKNSPTSTNSYKPVLTEDEAQRFTLRNVLGGTDSWDAATFTKQCAAPADAAADGTALQWAAVENALCYVVFKDGEYAGNTTATSFNLSAAGTYCVRAANAMGGMGEPSAPVEVKTVTSVSTVSSCEERGVYKKTQNGQLVIVSPQGVFSASGSRLK